MLLYAQAAVSGLLTAGVLTLIAVGFSVQWRSLKVVNLAHFGFVLLAAYLTYELSMHLRINPFAILILVIPAFALLGVVFQALVERFHVTLFGSLVLSFAIYILLEGIIIVFWGQNILSIDEDIDPYRVASFDIGDIAVPTAPLIAFAIAAPIVVLATLMLRGTYFGKGMRAMVEDRDIAIAYGVNYRYTSMIIAAVGGALAGIAGNLVAISTPLFPNTADSWIGLTFAIVILGGVGSPLGAFAGAALIGVLTGLGTVKWGTSTAQVITFGILIVVLVLRPSGLFTRLRS